MVVAGAFSSKAQMQADSQAWWSGSFFFFDLVSCWRHWFDAVLEMLNLLQWWICEQALA